jgi:surface antigen
MRTLTAAAIAASMITLGACGPGAQKSDVGLGAGAVLGGVIGNQFGKGSGRVLGTVAGAVIGGVVGHDIGRGLDERDRLLAEEAEAEAFERGYAGRPVRWRNPNNGRYGEIVPMERYRRGPRDCRDFTHTVYIDGRPQAMRGTACRNPDGTWSNVG